MELVSKNKFIRSTPDQIYEIACSYIRSDTGKAIESFKLATEHKHTKSLYRLRATEGLQISTRKILVLCVILKKLSNGTKK
jgi:hypothetical protein